MGHSCRTLLWDTPVGHTLRTRLPPKVTLRGCKTSVSYETSSKSHASSLKNERFLRDFLQKSHVKSPKRAFRTRLPPKVTCQVPKTSVHVKVCKTNVSHETSSKSPPLTRQSQLPIPCACHESFRVHTSNAHKVHVPATKCHLRHTSQPHDSLRLPRKSHFHTSKPAQSPAPATKSKTYGRWVV